MTLDPDSDCPIAACSAVGPANDALPESLPLPLLFYDGDWGLCRRVVYRVAQTDRAGRLHFAPLQGVTAAAALPPALVAASTTAVLLEARGLHVRSGAILRVWGLLPWPWRALAALWVVPRPVRDAVYDWVAARRQRLRLGPLEWAGPRSAAEQMRFLP